MGRPSGFGITTTTASQSQGTLCYYKLEKWATEKVCKAGKWKNQRLKQAKEEVQSEIVLYCLEKEKVQGQARCGSGIPGSCSTEVKKDTQKKMIILQAYFRQNRDEVPDCLLAFATSSHKAMKTTA